MSDKTVCPECKNRPVPEGRYVCAPCEASLVAATNPEPKSARLPGFAWLSRAGQAFAYFARRAMLAPRKWRVRTVGNKVQESKEGKASGPPQERPRWFQYVILATLLVVSVTWMLLAREYAKARPFYRTTQAYSRIDDIVHSLSQSWKKLCDALTK